jgi:hypothetical protein
MITKLLLSSAALSAALFTTNVMAQDVQDVRPSPDGVLTVFQRDHFSPYSGRNFPTRVLWGDTHLHTEVFSGRGYNEPPQSGGRI